MLKTQSHWPPLSTEGGEEASSVASACLSQCASSPCFRCQGPAPIDVMLVQKVPGSDFHDGLSSYGELLAEEPVTASYRLPRRRPSQKRVTFCGEPVAGLLWGRPPWQSGPCRA